jgi:hypothetical protein
VLAKALFHAAPPRDPWVFCLAMSHSTRVVRDRPLTRSPRRSQALTFRVLGERPWGTMGGQTMPGNGDGTKAISLFYSYSHKDEDLRLKLQDHLAPLKWSGMIAED